MLTLHDPIFPLNMDVKFDGKSATVEECRFGTKSSVKGGLEWDRGAIIAYNGKRISMRPIYILITIKAL